MSDRASWTTQYIYCPDCVRATLKYLVNEADVKIHHYDEKIISGYVSSSGRDCEPEAFGWGCAPIKGLCKDHSVTIVTINESGKVVRLVMTRDGNTETPKEIPRE